MRFGPDDLEDDEDQVDGPEDEEDGAEGAVEDDEGSEDEGDSDEDEDESSGAPDDQRSEASRGQPQATQRFQRRVAREVEKATAPLKEELDRLRAQSQQPRQPQETPEQRRARLDAMDPWDRSEYLRTEDNARHQSEIAQLRFDNADRSDRTAFEAICAREPAAQKLRADVEANLREMRSRGMDAPRETIYNFLLGQRARVSAPKRQGRQQRQADDNRQRQSARTGTGRSDTASREERGAANEREARRKRLEDASI